MQGEKLLDVMYVVAPFLKHSTICSVPVGPTVRQSTLSICYDNWACRDCPLNHLSRKLIFSSVATVYLDTCRDISNVYLS
jgi:hypothetical protein